MGHRIRTWIAAACGVSALALAAAGPEAAFGGGEPEDPAIVELGRRLFFDPAISRSGTNACASCHDPEHGWSSANAHDEDDYTPNPRHAMSLVDVADRTGKLHWDGEYAQVEQLVVVRLGVPSASIPRYGHEALRLPGFNDVDRPLATRPDPNAAPAREPTLEGPTTPADGGIPASIPRAPLANRRYVGYAPTAPNPTGGPGFDPLRGQRPPNLMTFRDEEGRRRVLDLQRLYPVTDRIERDGRYAEAFEAGFGSRAVTVSRLSRALGAFARSVRSTESPYDRFVAGDSEALSVSAQRGLDLFRGDAGCARCHTLDVGRATFTDERFHVTGIVARSYGGAAGIDRDEDVKNVLDTGRERLSRNPDDGRAFRTPTLRDVARRGPWMHDGSMKSLADVVDHYALGAVPDPRLDPLVQGFEISDLGRRDLVAFLESLSGDVRPGLAPDLRTRAKTTRVRLLDVHGRPLVGLAVGTVPAGDRLPGDVPLTSPERRLVTDRDGAIEFEPTRRTHTRLVLPDGLRLPQGEFIPDTCRHVDLTVPVVGRASLLVTTTRSEDAVERLLATIPELPEDAVYDWPGPSAILPLPAALSINPRRVFFVRVGTAVVGRAVVARYEAFVPTSAPDVVLVPVPAGPSRDPWRVRLADGAETRIDLRLP